MAVKSLSCPFYRLQRISLVGQLGFLDRGNVDIVAVEESQQFSDFAADSVRVTLYQTLTVSGCWCRVRSRLHFDITGTLKQKSEQQCRHRPLHHQKGDLTSGESS